MRLPKLFRAEAQKSEIDEEIAAHLALAAADKRDLGADAASAEQKAQREFGNPALVKDITREAWGWLWLERLQLDMNYALRQMRKSPGFAAAVIGTLAVGIAAATAMFTVVDHVLLRPLPYRHSSRLVEIKETTTRYAAAPYLDLEQWRKWSRSFSGIGYYSPGNGRSFLEGRTATESVEFYTVSANLFPVLGVRPALGRDFRDQTNSFAQSADAHNILLSDAAWREMFGGDPNVVGHSVKIDGASYIVAGVMPRGFSFPFAPENLQVWALNQLGNGDKGRTDSTPRYLVIGRLAKEANLERAQAELKILQAQIVKGYVDPEARKEYSTVWLHKYGDSLVDADTKRALEMLLAASAVLWLIACVNVTNLLLARAMVRQREIAMRGALGAGRGRIVQQFAVEGLLLSGCGAVIGLGLALLAVKLFANAIKHHLPLPVAVVPDVRVLLALLVLTVVSALVASMWPAFMAARAPIEPALKQGGMQSGSARNQNRLRNVLVVIEISLSLTLLAGCGLMLRTIYALRHVPLGFRTDHIIVANLQIPAYKFSGRNMSGNLYLPLLERTKYLPGVQAAGLLSEVPLGQTFNVELTLDGKDSELFGNRPKKVTAKLNAVSPELQKVFHFNMLAGRFFDQEDTASSLPVFVVNRALVHAYAPAEHDLRKIIGTKISHLTPNGKQAEIIGVLDDFRQAGVALDPEP
ncbi:MAG TPA: ABC transporter permease, partial [Bryobacteraceae bacterium]|nr:ABC transporter permease [Bryobacteraceae bacterium]